MFNLVRPVVVAFFALGFVSAQCAAADAMTDSQQYNADLRLDQEVGFYYLAENEPNTLVLLFEEAYGVGAARYTALSEVDTLAMMGMTPKTPYNCRFERFAALCQVGTPGTGCGYPYYRYYVKGLSCARAH